jgi:hypothetical protein
MHSEEVKNLRLNYIVNVLDGAFFGFGLGFASFATVIPLFVSTMTDSAILIGLISAVHLMGWQVPQLLTAQSVSRMARFKPTVMWMTIHERLPFLGLALIALFYFKIGTLPAILLTFAMLVWQGFGAGFTANAWQNMIGKVIPSDYLATFFGVQSSAANLLASGGAVLAEPANNPLFTTGDGQPLTRDHLYNTITSIAARVGVENADVHRFRHTFAINYLRNGGDAYTLQILLGHTSMEMVRTYIQIAQSDIEARHLKASPVANWNL